MKLLQGCILCAGGAKHAPEKDAQTLAQEAIARGIDDAAFLDWENPEWDSGGRVHNWHNYASEAMQVIWQTFSAEQKQIIAATLDECASNEYWD